MKKIISTILAMMLIFAMTLTAFAEEGTGEGTGEEDNTKVQIPTRGTYENTKGKITINGVNGDSAYKIYQILRLKSFNKTDGKYAYEVVDEKWNDFLARDAVKALLVYDAETESYTWIGNKADAVIAQFAKDALEYAKLKGIDPKMTHDKDHNAMDITGNVGVFDDLELGWYLVDSTVGALCGLTTTDPYASINAKNHIPELDKQVQEDLSGTWGYVNSADIGQVVDFMVEIKVVDGAENYVVHDVMSDHFNFVHGDDNYPNRGITEIRVIKSAGGDDIIASPVPTPNADGEGTRDADYVVSTTRTCDEEGCTFEIAFSDTFISELKSNDRILVYYNAMLNRYAETDKDGKNINEAFLEFGEDHFTTHKQTNTNTFSIDIIKTDSTNKLIDGAEFLVYDAKTNQPVDVVYLMESDDETHVLDDNGNPMYRRARADEIGTDAVVQIKVTDGQATIIGFDCGDYYLKEEIAPDGYHKLEDPIYFTISDKNLTAIFNDGIYSTGSGVHVVNKGGTMLPETGAAGTMMFITFGTVAVLATGVLLVTKKRMSMIVE